MYSSRGSNNSYGQQEQSYTSQSAYTQNLGPSYPGSSVARPEGTSQVSGVSLHSSVLGVIQEGDIGGYRGGHTHHSSGPHYGGQYSSAYSSAGQQIHQMSTKPSMPSLEGRSGFTSSLPDSPKFTSSDYMSLSNHGYGHKVEQLFTDRVSDYSPGDRHHYADRRSAYMGKDLPSEPAARYAESVAFGHKHQV